MGPAKADVASFLAFNARGPIEATDPDEIDDVDERATAEACEEIGFPVVFDEGKFDLADASGVEIEAGEHDKIIDVVAFLCLLRHCLKHCLVGAAPERMPQTGFLAVDVGVEGAEEAGNGNLMATDMLQALVYKQFSASTAVSATNGDGLLAAGSLDSLEEALPSLSGDHSKEAFQEYLCALMHCLVAPCNRALGTVTATAQPPPGRSRARLHKG